MKSINCQVNQLVESSVNVSEQKIAFGYSKKIILKMLDKLEIGLLRVVDGNNTFEFGDRKYEQQLSAIIYVHNNNAYRKILFSGTIGVGESFMKGWWTTDDLTSVVRIFVSNQTKLNNMDSKASFIFKRCASFLEKFSPNSLRGSKKNIAAHYDLSNEFYSLFLDNTMMYSSAIFTDDKMTLQDASEYKLQHICERLNLNQDDHLLEIGSGWGGLAIYAAKHYGCRVTTTTISREQYLYAKAQIEREKLTDKITLLEKDYRMLEGKFDKIASIEMIEAVGYKYYKQYFSVCNRLLKTDGALLIQAITTTDQRYHSQKDRIDFIRRYVFPGGCLPSNAEILSNTAKYTDMHLVGLEDITLDYARTLRHWRENFFNHIHEVRTMHFSEAFIRLWDFYLCYCEGGFRERVINTSQFLFHKPNNIDMPKVLNYQ